MNSSSVLGAIAIILIASAAQGTEAQAFEASFKSGGKVIHCDEYRVQNPTKAPAVIVLHGSGGLSSHNFPFAELAKRLSLQGFLILIPHYLDATDGSPANAEIHYEKWIKVTEDSLHYLRARSDVDKTRIAILGFSLGASIALAAASQGLPVAAMVECSGSLPDDYFHRFRAMPPLLILHNAADPVMPASNAEQLARLCKMRQLSCQVHIGAGREHGLPTPQDQALREIQDFLAAKVRQPVLSR